MTPTDVKRLHFTVCYFFSAAGSGAKLLDSLNNTTIPIWGTVLTVLFHFTKNDGSDNNKALICNLCQLSDLISFQSTLLWDVY